MPLFPLTISPCRHANIKCIATREAISSITTCDCFGVGVLREFPRNMSKAKFEKWVKAIFKKIWIHLAHAKR